jgi:hypothetical protein
VRQNRPLEETRPLDDHQSPVGRLIDVSYLRMSLSCSPSVWLNAKPRVRRMRWTALTLRMAFWN